MLKQFISFLVILFSSLQIAFALPKSELKETLNVYIDCNRCDLDYLRENIPVVNFMRDRNDADLHILFTHQRTGSRGREYTLYFLGLKNFKSINDTLVFNTIDTDTEDDTRRKIADNLKLGLFQYLLRTDSKDNIKIVFKNLVKDKADKVVDNWDYWLFRTNIRGFFNGRETSKSLNVHGSFSANRTTKDLKLHFSLSGSYNEDRFDYDDEKILNASRSQRFSASAIFSMDDHWSWGLRSSARKSTYSNIKLGLYFSPQLEYNVFPYSESNKKQFRIEYRLTNSYNKYLEQTIYFKHNENLLSQELEISLEIIEPWGSVSTSLEGSNYFFDFNKNLLELSSNVSVNLFKGFSLDLWGRISRVRNQISLPIGSASIDEVILERKELETQYAYYGSIGISYSFGSIYNNVVNPRFGD